MDTNHGTDTTDKDVAENSSAGIPQKSHNPLLMYSCNFPNCYFSVPKQIHLPTIYTYSYQPIITRFINQEENMDITSQSHI